MFMCMDNVYRFSNAKYEVIFEKKREILTRVMNYESSCVDKIFTTYKKYYFRTRIFKKNTIRHVLFLSRLYNNIYAHNNHIFKM